MSVTRLPKRLSRLSPLFAVALFAAGCGGTQVVSSEGNGTKVTAAVGIENVVFGAIEVREHQRLAHDLYDQFARIHVEQAFRLARDARRQNIDSLGRLLRNRDSFAPAAILPRGEFDDPGLAAEYKRLLAIGSESEAAAFRVGALLEERDAAMVRGYGRETAASDVTALYSRLERTNRAHLSTFVTHLRTMGEHYNPATGRVTDVQAMLEAQAEDKD
jgi:hypothetical protein